MRSLEAICRIKSKGRRKGKRRGRYKKKRRKREKTRKQKESGSSGKTKRRRVSEHPDSTDDEDVDGAIVPISEIVDDSSDYSEEFPENLEMEGSYPFAQKQPSVSDLV